VTPRSAVIRLLVGGALLGLLAAPSDALAQKKPGKGEPAAAKKVSKSKKKSSSKRRGKRKGKRASAKGATKAKGKTRVKTFDFTGLDLAGRLRTPQLIYFLDRAAQELEIASLERRSFIPEFVKSVDEESL